MSIIQDSEATIFSAKKPLLIIGGAVLSILAVIKFKK